MGKSSQGARLSDGADQLMRGAELLGVYCSSLEARAVMDDVLPARHPKFALEPNYTVGHRVIDMSAELDGRMVLDCRLGVDLLVKWPQVDDSGATVAVVDVARLAVSHVARYAIRMPDGCNNDHCQEFANTVAVRMLWPFLRESLHALTWRIGLAPFVLPVLPALEENTDDGSASVIRRRSMKRKTRSK